MPMVTQQSAMIKAMGLNPPLPRKLQLNMTLSVFDKENSDYSGILIITEKDNKDKIVVLSFSQDKLNVRVTENKVAMIAWHKRSIENDTLTENEYNIVDENGQLAQVMQSTEEAESEQQKNKIYFLLVNQLLGEFDDSRIEKPYNYQLVMHYWRSKSEDSSPLVLSYQYNA